MPSKQAVELFWSLRRRPDSTKDQDKTGDGGCAPRARYGLRLIGNVLPPVLQYPHLIYRQRVPASMVVSNSDYQHDHSLRASSITYGDNILTAVDHTIRRQAVYVEHRTTSVPPSYHSHATIEVGTRSAACHTARHVLLFTTFHLDLS